MPVITAAIDPVSRIEGHLKIEVKVDSVGGVQQVVDAYSVGTLFRGFEKIMENRDPRDGPIITSRICGVCPTSHAQAAAQTLDAAFGVTVPDAGRILRNLVHGACYLESHVLHFYLLSAPDYIQGPGMFPWTPGFQPDHRVDGGVAAALLGHYVQATEIRRKAHEMGAIFAGKLPHTPAYVAGGFTATPSADDLAQFKAYLDPIVAFIANTYLPDVELLASLYPEYFSVGRGFGNLLAYGAFDLNATGSSRLFRRGRLESGSSTLRSVSAGSVTESVTHSWYDESGNNLNPAVGATDAQHPKDGAYSWLKSPRYAGASYEVGPLARMSVNGDYVNGVSVMDRHLARAREALKIGQAMQQWLKSLTAGAKAYADCSVPATATAMGLTEAPRGALGHWVSIADSKIRHYQIITPTCWNCSPRDTTGRRGPLEEGLIGTPVANVDEPVEVLRVVHSFDPCLDCATHVTRPGEGARVFALGAIGCRIGDRAKG